MQSVKVRMQTAVGPLAVVGTDRGITEIYFEGSDTSARRPGGDGGHATTAPSDIPAPIYAAIEQLEQYFRGERTTFDFAMHYEGTDFQRRVWSQLLAIPAGETRTYGEVAQEIGNPKAARAVGGAVGSNPISVAVPCHRVVAADGRGGGYGGGMRAKRYLLQIEGVNLTGAEDESTD